MAGAILLDSEFLEFWEFFELFEFFEKLTQFHTTLVQFDDMSICTKNGIYYCAIFIYKKC